MLLHHRPPRDESESNAIIEHGEATAREVKRAAIHAADRLAVPRFAIGQVSLGLDRFADRGKFTVAQGREQIVLNHQLIVLPFGEALLEQEGEPLAHRLPHFRAKCVSSTVRSFAHQVLIEPGGADRTDLLFDGER